ncbi:hypothetical protein E2562_019608 [Oryza meyeriana var. granulata]|uniref:Uncharacterized protein n=1 Tax=Oryza meyeriana var. granulata TaxID=110450 RepID=A0A6G1C7I4_9ORYZ|nr:hypothetical protein E2562_019608 [Oryza meyeriana var. granulata]
MEPPRGTRRPLPTDSSGSGDDDDGERKPRFPKGKKAKYHDPAAAEGIDGLINPELGAEQRARQRHRKDKDDQQGAASDVRGFKVRYDIGQACVASRPSGELLQS